MTNKNLIDLEAMSVKQIDKLVKKAKKIMQSPADYRHACDGKILATLFYEPSTRTQMSFQTAMLKLGGRTIGFDNPMNSSVAKGENLKDTIAVISGYSDIIAIRHPTEGTAMAASLYSEVPVINCGDGGHLHPTQTLTDIVTLSCEKGRLDHLKIGVCGDLLNGRTVHSLIKALSKYEGNSFVLISTPELSVPIYIIDILEKNHCRYEISNSLAEAVKDLDMLYMTYMRPPLVILRKIDLNDVHTDAALPGNAAGIRPSYQNEISLLRGIDCRGGGAKGGRLVRRTGARFHLAYHKGVAAPCDNIGLFAIKEPISFKDAVEPQAKIPRGSAFPEVAATAALGLCLPPHLLRNFRKLRRWMGEGPCSRTAAMWAAVG